MTPNRKSVTDMLEQTATVIDIEDGQLILEVRPQSSCHGCAVNKGCGTAVLAKTVGQRVVHFRLDNTIGARKGDTVVLGLPEHAVLKGALIIYLLPLLVMLLVALVADATLAADADNRDLAIVLLSLLGLGGSVWLGRVLMQHDSQAAEKAYTPVLLRREIDLAVPR